MVKGCVCGGAGRGDRPILISVLVHEAREKVMIPVRRELSRDAQ
jgi:hypothetical protein